MAAKQGNWPVNTKLRAQVEEMLQEIQRLQCALNFWLPTIPAAADEKVFERMEHDACLLVGFDGPLEPTAETLGWVELKAIDYTKRAEVMNPPESAAEGSEVGNLNSAQRDGTGAVPGRKAMGTEAQATQPSAALMEESK